MSPKTAASDFRKEKIVSRAAVLMSQTGYEKFTIKALADRLGISPSGILYHFANKGEIFEAIVTSIVTDGIGIIEQAMRGANSPGIEEVQIWINAHYDWLEKAPYRKALLVNFYAQTLRNKRLASLQSNIVKVGIERIKKIILRGQENGAFAPFDANQKAQQLHSLLSGQLVYFSSADSLKLDVSYDRNATFEMAKLLLLRG